jgi:hypothetical protein
LEHTLLGKRMVLSSREHTFSETHLTLMDGLRVAHAPVHHLFRAKELTMEAMRRRLQIRSRLQEIP